jgi:hypothetical protein
MPGPPRFGGAPITNIRNTASSHWRAWLNVEQRCVVPFNSFCEYADTLHRDGADLAASAADAVSVAADFQKLRELRLQLLASLGDFGGNHGFDFGTQAFQLTRRHLFQDHLRSPTARMKSAGPS